MVFKPYQNNLDSKEYRRQLRILPTKAEYVLWQELRRKKLNYKFRRQFGIGVFIVDFYCHELKLIIEVDGPIHDEQKTYDAKREKWLELQGNTVIRFTNDEVLFEREKVIEKITSVCKNINSEGSFPNEGKDR